MSFLKVETGYTKPTGYGFYNGKYQAINIGTNPLEWDKNEIVAESEVKRLKDFYKDIKSSEIDTEGKIFFHEQATFPRRKLKDIVVNKIARDVSDAEFIVINQSYFTKLNIYSYYRYWNTNGLWISGGGNGSGLPFSRYEGVLKEVDKFTYDILGKKIIIDSSLVQLLPRETKIEGNFYNTLTKMLGSDQKDDIKIGLQLLTDVNYEDHKSEIALLLNKNIRNITDYQLGYTVMFKSLLEMINRDFPTWRHSENLDFIMNMAGNSKDKKIMDYVNSYFNQRFPLTGKKYKIIVEDE